MVERGEGEKCFGDWIYKETLHATFNLPRNDTVLLHPDVPKRRMKEGESDIRTGPFQETFDIDIVLTPAIKTWRIGKYTMFKSCEIDGDKVSLGLTFKAGKTAIIRDFFGKICLSMDGMLFWSLMNSQRVVMHTTSSAQITEKNMTVSVL
jgi:hypothetical protein